MKYKSYMQSVSNMFRDSSYIILQMHIHTKRSSKMMLKVNWSLGSIHLIFRLLLAMCKRCRDHLQILTENASPVSQGNPTLVNISSSYTPAGDTLEEKRSESSQHKSTQVGSEKSFFCKCLLGRYLCFPNGGTPTTVKGKICANGTIPLDR